MKRQQAPKPEAQEPSDNPPLSEHSRGDRQTPAIIYWWPKKSGLYEMDPCVKKKAQKKTQKTLQHYQSGPPCMRSWLLLQTLFGKLTMLKRPKNLPSLVSRLLCYRFNQLSLLTCHRLGRLSWHESSDHQLKKQNVTCLWRARQGLREREEPERQAEKKTRTTVGPSVLISLPARAVRLNKLFDPN